VTALSFVGFACMLICRGVSSVRLQVGRAFMLSYFVSTIQVKNGAIVLLSVSSLNADQLSRLVY